MSESQVKQYQYIPILKTTDAEIRGFENLKPAIKLQLFPLFELTKSRRSKNNQDASVEKRMEKLLEILEPNSSFILDVTAHEDLSNLQIEQFSDEASGFANWCEFVEHYQSTSFQKLIPVIHVFPEDEGVNNEITAQISRLDKRFNNLAFRYSIAEDAEPLQTDEEICKELSGYLDLIISVMDSNKLVLILDAQFVNQSNIANKTQLFTKLVEVVEGYGELAMVSLSSSSFPKSVIGHPNCLDHKGSISLLEKDFYSSVCKNVLLGVIYSDYASIHPYRKIMKGGGWVPRVDYPMADRIIYKRYRRKFGGFVTAAKELANDAEFILDEAVTAWGYDQIKLAILGSPSGKSPAFWISVRVNLHISRLFLGKNLPRCLVK